MRVELGNPELAALSLHAAKSADFIYGGVSFIHLGTGLERVALEGPDGICYKAPIGGVSCYQVEAELRLFDRISGLGLSWAPDYWPHRHGVVAMPVYRQITEYEFEALPMDSNYYDTLHEIMGMCGDISGPNLGLKVNGDLVLLDGGFSLYEWGRK